ncbi:allophanate hydrolase subunit 1 [soil metagenome]
MRVLACGDDALLVEVASSDQVLALQHSLISAPLEGVLEVVPAARTVLLRVSPDADLTAVTAQVRTLELRPPDQASGELVEIPVVYDGADLPEVCRLTGLAADQVVAAHIGVELRVGFVGFAPGFGYLVGLPESLHVPRRDRPRTKVPAGAVGLAGEFTGVYPRECPGGWQLIGHTDLVLWDLQREPPALLVPGTRVRFVPA